MLRPRLRIPLRPRVGTPAQSTLMPLAMACRTRAMHSIAPLEYNMKGEASNNGIGDFLSRDAFNIAWTQYQTHLLERLNAVTAETEWESKNVKDILLGTAREPGDAPLFNYASMIHNNHFFFKHLTPKPVDMPENLRTHLESSFGSLDTLRQEMVYTAAGMFAPGFVWLVKVSQAGLPVAFKVLATYAAGSPYPGAHWRKQDVDMNTSAGGGTGASEGAIEGGRDYLGRAAYGAGKRGPGAGPGDAGAVAKKVVYAPGGTDLLPVLCLNTWEHAWLWDYGFGVGNPRGGKLAYAEKWWQHINWELVHKEANIERLKMSGSTGAP